MLFSMLFFSQETRGRGVDAPGRAGGEAAKLFIPEGPEFIWFRGGGMLGIQEILWKNWDVVIGERRRSSVPGRCLQVMQR